MALRSKVNRLEEKARANRQAKNYESFFTRFLDANNREMVLCKDGKERQFEEWSKMRGIDQHLAELETETIG